MRSLIRRRSRSSRVTASSPRRSTLAAWTPTIGASRRDQNPQTGPFYIEGAEPGDMLVVTLNRLEPNRMTARSATLLAPYAIDPAFLRSTAERQGRQETWMIDRGKGIARTTTELLRWLMSDYGFDERTASMLMGQAVEYEIANVVDPHFTVVAKLRKTYLRPR
jgi:acetamidase/formamidase